MIAAGIIVGSVSHGAGNSGIVSVGLIPWSSTGCAGWITANWSELVPVGESSAKSCSLRVAASPRTTSDPEDILGA